MIRLIVLWPVTTAETRSFLLPSQKLRAKTTNTPKANISHRKNPFLLHANYEYELMCGQFAHRLFTAQLQRQKHVWSIFRFPLTSFYRCRKKMKQARSRKKNRFRLNYCYHYSIRREWEGMTWKHKNTKPWTTPSTRRWRRCRCV